MSSPETSPDGARWRFLGHALGCALVLYAGLAAIAPVDPGAPGGAGPSALRHLAALSHASVVAAVLAGIAWSIARLARREGAAFAVLGGLTGTILGAAYFDSRFLVFFGRHVYHPATIDLVSTPGITDQSGVGAARGSLMLAGWIAVVVALALVAHATRARSLGPRRVVTALALVLAVNATWEHLPIDAIPGASWLEQYREGLFLRGLMRGRTLAAAEDARPFTYPLGSLGPPARGERPDVLFIVVESLRADVLRPEVMPETSRHAAHGFVGVRHYAGANCTANAWFTLLYGTNGTTYARFGDTAHPVASAPLAWLRESGYVLEMYSSEDLAWQNMDALFVGPAFDEIIEDAERGEDWERDARLVEHYFARGARADRPRFSVIFFTSSHHDYSFPPHRAPFQPSLRPLEVMESDLRPYRTELVNRYQNSVSYVDSLIGQLLDRLEDEGRLDRMRVVITGDHGEEFLEHGHLTHASSLVEEQIHVPLVVRGVPGLSGTSSETTSHAQILPTLLASIAEGLDFASTGSGVPIGRGGLAIASECAWEPGMFVAVDGERKHWFSVEQGSIRLDFVSDAHDVVVPDAAPDPETMNRIRAAVAHFGGGGTFERELWPCPTVEAAGEVFHLCERWIAWPEARDICRSHGLELATFVDAEQSEIVAAAATAGEHESAWIGLTDAEQEGDFRWAATGAAPTFTRWAEGEPSNGSGREHCVQVQRDGTWTDRVCEARDVFICGPRR